METSVESLPDGVLVKVLLRLPLAALLPGKQVCRKWNELIESRFFRQTYRSIATMVETVDYSASAYLGPSYRFTDSNNTALRWRKQQPDQNLGGITSHINGLLVTFSRETHKYHVCNVFADKWEEIPSTPDRFNIGETAVFNAGAGQYKLVFWSNLSEEIWTLSTGQQGWSLAMSMRLLLYWPRSYSHPVVMGSSIFRVRLEDGTLSLLEYTIQGHLASKPIRHQGKAFDLDRFGRLEVIAWRNELYLVMEKGDLEGRQWVQIWRLSADDGCVTFVKIGMERRVAVFHDMDLAGDGLLRLEGINPYDGVVVLVLYDLATNLVLHSGVTEARHRQMTVAVRLDEFERIL